MAVNVGSSSRLRVVDKPVIPSTVPIWRNMPMMFRETGAHTTLSFLLSIVRSIWKPQRCASAWRPGYLRLLNGMAISAVQPSSTIVPADSKSASQKLSPGAPLRRPPLVWFWGTIARRIRSSKPPRFAGTVVPPKLLTGTTPLTPGVRSAAVPVEASALLSTESLWTP